MPLLIAIIVVGLIIYFLGFQVIINTIVVIAFILFLVKRLLLQ